MAENIEPRLARVETAVAVGVAEVKNVYQGVTDIKAWLQNHTKEYRESQEKKEEYHVEIVQRLASIEENQNGFKNYQIKCETDRKSMNDDIETIKLKQSNQAGKASIISTIISSVVGAAVGFGAAILGRHP